MCECGLCLDLGPAQLLVHSVGLRQAGALSDLSGVEPHHFLVRLMGPVARGPRRRDARWTDSAGQGP